MTTSKGGESPKADANYGWAQPGVNRLYEARPEPAFIRWCAGADRITRHYVALAIRGLQATKADAARWAVTADQLDRCGRRAVLSEAWRRPIGGPRLLRGLPRQVMARGRYDDLAEVMGRPELVKAAGNETLDASTLRALAGASAHPTRPELAAVKRHGAAWVDYLVAGVLRRRPDLELATIHRRLAEADDHQLARGLVNLIGEVPLPPPPAIAAEGVTAATSVGDLQTWALEYRNCLADEACVGNGISGSQAFYRVDSPKAVVALAHDPLLDAWRVEEVKGPGNRDLPARTLRRVLAPFEAAGFRFLSTERLGYMERL